MSAEVYRSLRTLIEYLFRDERTNWEESGRPAYHIFEDVRRVATWLDERNAREHRCDGCGEPFEAGEEPAFDFDAYESRRPLELHAECWDAANGL